jgi:SOS-response transcriptional repressor LexA
MKKTKIGKILNQLMAEKKIRAAELARQIGLPQPTIHRIATGAIEHPHLSSLEPIARFFSISVEQLKGHDLIPALDKVSKVPLLTWAQAVDWPLNKDEIDGRELIFTDANVGLNAYALKVNDVSMDPVFPKNTLLIADPDKEFKDRSYVVAKLSSTSDPIFRQLLIDANDYYLKALSPDFDQYKMTYLNKNDNILSIVVQARRDCED